MLWLSFTNPTDIHPYHPSMSSRCLCLCPERLVMDDIFGTWSQWALTVKKKNCKYVGYPYFFCPYFTDKYFVNPQGILECQQLHNKIQHSTGIKIVNTKHPNGASKNISLNTDKTDAITWICSGGNCMLYEISVGTYYAFLFKWMFYNHAQFKK